EEDVVSIGSQWLLVEFEWDALPSLAVFVGERRWGRDGFRSPDLETLPWSKMRKQME
ncbi:hypothetical protein ACLOJK_029263, partial [Asimina triloba]